MRRHRHPPLPAKSPGRFSVVAMDARSAMWWRKADGTWSAKMADADTMSEDAAESLAAEERGKVAKGLIVRAAYGPRTPEGGR